VTMVPCGWAGEAFRSSQIIETKARDTFLNVSCLGWDNRILTFPASIPLNRLALLVKCETVIFTFSEGRCREHPRQSGTIVFSLSAYRPNFWFPPDRMGRTRFSGVRKTVNGAASQRRFATTLETGLGRPQQMNPAALYRWRSFSETSNCKPQRC
jgi:hypothetical protein